MSISAPLDLSFPRLERVPRPAVVAPVLDSPIVSTQWLCDHLGSDGLVVLDARAWRDERIRPKRIPGTVPADAGIDAASTIVIHDGGPGRKAARLWWVLRSLGFENVAVLSGGLAKWKAEGRPLEKVTPTDSAAPHTGFGGATVARPDAWADAALVDTITDGSTDGVVLQASDGLVDPATGAFLKRKALAERFAEVTQRLNSHSPIVVVEDGSGNAFVDALALAALGETNVSVYEGSSTTE